LIFRAATTRLLPCRSITNLVPHRTNKSTTQSPQVSLDDIHRHDDAISSSRKAFDKWGSDMPTLGRPLYRKLLVGNLRSADGRKRVPKLMFHDSEGYKFMSLSKADFDKLVEELPYIKAELLRYKKKIGS